MGDIIKSEDGDIFPADLIIVNSGLENGICYIETSSLDGEKNLKPKLSIKESIPWYSD